MSKEYNIHITVDYITATHVLGGLARNYRDLPASAPSNVSNNLIQLIRDVVRQLHLLDVNVMEPRSPFHTYVKLCKYNPNNYKPIK
jgi:hypothetical protein